jgi:putative membrane protein
VVTDLELAVGHHLLVFALVALMAAEFALIRPGLAGRALLQVARLDGAYGASATLIVVVGIARVAFGIKGADYYLGNPWFWGKMVAFALIAVLSIVPTVALLKWRRALNGNPGFVPASDAVRRVRSFVAAQLALLPVVLVCAAAMARFGALL